jgi:hypothetical protein
MRLPWQAAGTLGSSVSMRATPARPSNGARWVTISFGKCSTLRLPTSTTRTQRPIRTGNGRRSPRCEKQSGPKSPSWSAWFNWLKTQKRGACLERHRHAAPHGRPDRLLILLHSLPRRSSLRINSSALLFRLAAGGAQPDRPEAPSRASPGFLDQHRPKCAATCAIPCAAPRFVPEHVEQSQ